jgi:hypothetical protein
MLKAKALYSPIHRTTGAGPSLYPRSRAHTSVNYGSSCTRQPSNLIRRICPFASAPVRLARGPDQAQAAPATTPPDRLIQQAITWDLRASCRLCLAQSRPMP